LVISILVRLVGCVIFSVLLIRTCVVGPANDHAQGDDPGIVGKTMCDFIAGHEDPLAGMGADCARTDALGFDGTLEQ
jgi:hypothetical protein